MPKPASQLFREFLACLRENGTVINLPDNEVAILLRDALDVVHPDEDDVDEAATNLSMDFDALATEIYHQLRIEDAQHPQQPLNLESPS